MSDSVLSNISLCCWVVWLTLVSALGAHNQDWLLHYTTKPFIMGSMLLYVQFTAPPGVPERGCLLGAMALAMLGDILIMIQEADLFIFSMGAFIGMQVCYGLVFWRGIRASARRPTLGRYVAVGGPVLLFLAYFIYYLGGIFSQNPALQPLWAPTAAYALVLGALCVLGILWHMSVSNQRFPLVGLGAVLFLAATSLQAIMKFEPSVSTYFGYVILVIYALSQVFMVIGYISVYEPAEAPAYADTLPPYTPPSVSSPSPIHYEQFRLS